jgi:hypothetical protein
MAVVKINNTVESLKPYDEAYVHIQAGRFLPYSIVFDIFSHFKNYIIN